MATQSDALRLMLAAVAAMREAGYTREDIHELAADAFDHIEAGGQRPHAIGHCSNCGRVIIGWSAYAWSMVVREPCPRCSKPW